jgi:hypothetical protein
MTRGYKSGVVLSSSTAVDERSVDLLVVSFVAMPRVEMIDATLISPECDHVDMTGALA